MLTRDCRSPATAQVSPEKGAYIPTRISDELNIFIDVFYSLIDTRMHRHSFNICTHWRQEIQILSNSMATDFAANQYQPTLLHLRLCKKFCDDIFVTFHQLIGCRPVYTDFRKSAVTAILFFGFTAIQYQPTLLHH